MAGRGRVTREAIVEHARRIVAEEGTGALTFQALAQALGVSKQAIIYWFPSKWELVREFSLPALKEEADATIAALVEARSAPEAIERFVRALVAHHLQDLGRFRVLYLSPQFDRRRALPANARDILAPVHVATSAMYAALEAMIAADPEFRPGESPRRLAVAAHMAGIGLLTMLALADSMDDPMAHQTGHLIDSLVALLTGPSRNARTDPNG